MGHWLSDGQISGYDYRPLERGGDIYQDVGFLATAGLYDAQIITRLQYGMAPASERNPAPRINALAAFNITGWPSGHPTTAGQWEIRASLFIVASTAFPGTTPPTPKQVLEATGVRVYRGAQVYSSGNDRGFRINGPWPNNLTPNTKYWAMVMPTWSRIDATPSVANDKPVVAGQENVYARGLSFWSNRPPNKPVITLPASGLVLAPGLVVNFKVNYSDPDAWPSATPGLDRTSIIGAQIQIARRPTPDNPVPEWFDMPIWDSFFGQQPGWTILGSAISTYGWWYVLQSGGDAPLPVLTGVEPSEIIETGPYDTLGYLPSGDWLVRVRTFDSGNPYTFLFADEEYDTRPIKGEVVPWVPDTYPTENISPWSDPITITITAQVPPPVPLSPTNSIAVMQREDGTPTTLRWQYRNTFDPPYAQGSYTVQVRHPGDEWTEYTATSSDSFIDLPELELGEWEWRVSVVDEDDEQSEWSQIARFWMVPLAGSGEVRPAPSSTVEGATLGCGDYRVFVYRRGGAIPVGEITNLSSVDWSRLRDDKSDAKIVISDWSVDCGNLLAKLQCWAYEIVIRRDNGYSRDRVWEGPIVRLTYGVDAVTIHANDVMAYAYRRIIKQPMIDTRSGDTVTNRAARVLQNVFAPDDPNVLKYLKVLGRDDDAKQYRSTPAYSRTAYEEVDDMAANAGLDYTVVGRSILLWGTKHRIGTLPEFRDADLGATPIVSEYGMSMANRYAVSDGNGVYGEATRLNADGQDPIYGLVEMLSSTWASDSPEDSGTYTQEGLQKVVESFAASAERSIADRYPPPVVVRIPDNTTVNPDAVVSIQQLVPGVVIPLRSTGTLRKVVASQKLDAVRVSWANGEEKIALTMSPFSRDDGSIEGGEEG